jgi:translation initiation factor IF-2
MSQSRDFGPQAADMRVALERYRKEELVELMLFIMKTYVLGNAVSPDIEVGPIHPPAALDRMSFPQLINHLQMALKLEELEHFRVSGPDVYVTIGEREFDLLGSGIAVGAEAPPPEVAAPARRAAASPAVAARPAPSSGGASTTQFAEMAAQARAQQPPRPAAARPTAAARPASASRPAAPAAPPPSSTPDLELDLPGASFANEADFEMDDAISQRIAERNPSPEPLVKGRREDAEFGGSRPRPTPQPSNTRLNRSPPPPPPPIAPQAAGDLTPEERARNRRNTSSPSAPPTANPNRARPGHEDRPALKGDDKEVTPNSRFGDLELD